MKTLLAIALIFPCLAFSEDPGQTTIAASSIGVDHVLVGGLGIPLGKIVHIIGTVSEHRSSHHKEGSFFKVHISHINDRKLDEEIVIPLWDRTPPATDIALQMTVVEDARYELRLTPNLPLGAEDEGRQSLITGLRVIDAKKAEQADSTKGSERPNLK